ncbi:MAG TPA: DUF3108 domain-containing protein [Stellaceae bacterium]|nr:DUF3108 domain-containing protein [Stellaceae bacterium]
MLALAAAMLPVSGIAAPPESLLLEYEAFAAGFPIVTFAFRLDETPSAYSLDGHIQAVGAFRLFYRVDVRAESQGNLIRDAAQPRWHEHVFTSKGRDRVARLDYPGDGRVAAQLVPAEDSGRPKPTEQQTVDTLDPLSAILAMGHTVARVGRCEGTFAVFDGRRRYDLTLTDEGGERIDAAPAYVGPVRRCHAAVLKIAGFSFDHDYQPRTTNGHVWFASPRPGAPALPIRIDFDGSWGLVEVRMTKVASTAEGDQEVSSIISPSERSASGKSEK